MFDLQNQYKNYSSNRILVVDDEEFCLTSMKALLLKFRINIDYQVDYCITGLEAVNLIKEMSQKGIFYKLILTDFCMPVMDGIKSSKKIRAYLRNHGYEQPIIVGVTGHVQSKYQDEAKDAGIDQIFAKPLHADHMEEILKNAGLI